MTVSRGAHSSSEKVTALAIFSQESFAWSDLKLYLSEKWAALVALAIASVLAALTESGVLAILAQSAAALVNGNQNIRIDIGPVHTSETLGSLLAIAFVLALVRLILQGVLAAVPARIAADLQAQLRSNLFAAFTRTSWDIQSRDREGHLQELATSQITQASAAALQALVFLTAVLTFAVLVLSALALNVVAALIVLMAASGLFVLLRPLSRLGSRRGHALSKASIAFAAGVNESVRLAEEAQAFGAGPAQRERVDELVDDVRTPYFQTQLLYRLVPGVYQSLIYLLVVAALVALHASGTGQIASLGAVVLLLVRAGTYGQQAQSSYQAIRQMLPYIHRVHKSTRMYTASIPTPGTRRITDVEHLAFDSVSFAYSPATPVLSRISFDVTAGEMIGIVGPTGAGKSTLIQILLGLRCPSSGRYLVNGTSASQFRQDDWHRIVAYLPQEPQLLHASVADNIRFFRTLSDEEVEHSARLAGIHHTVEGWAERYNTVVGPRANAISGGQQQRICLARSLVASPKVLILDEPTSALDPDTERMIQQSLAALKTQLTLFVVAHRVSTLDKCDRVMVVNQGRLQAFDTRDQLQATNPYFQSASQVGH